MSFISRNLGSPTAPRLIHSNGGFGERPHSIVPVEAPRTISILKWRTQGMKKRLPGIVLAFAGMLCFSSSVVMAQHRHIDRGERRALREDRRDIRSDTRDIRADQRDFRADARGR